jgi:hypothetical protein
MTNRRIDESDFSQWDDWARHAAKVVSELDGTIFNARFDAWNQILEFAPDLEYPDNFGAKLKLELSSIIDLFDGKPPWVSIDLADGEVIFEGTILGHERAIVQFRRWPFDYKQSSPIDCNSDFGNPSWRYTKE